MATMNEIQESIYAEALDLAYHYLAGDIDFENENVQEKLKQAEEQICQSNDNR